jgi:hypothetical protein
LLQSLISWRNIAAKFRVKFSWRALEGRLSHLVNQAYGLTPEEIALMWKTAPPRMPISPKSAPSATCDS